MQFKMMFPDRLFEVRRDCQKTIFALQRRGHQLALPIGHF
jgi:hypothetical protein